MHPDDLVKEETYLVADLVKEETYLVAVMVGGPDADGDFNVDTTMVNGDPYTSWVSTRLAQDYLETGPGTLAVQFERIDADGDAVMLLRFSDSKEIRYLYTDPRFLSPVLSVPVESLTTLDGIEAFLNG